MSKKGCDWINELQDDLYVKDMFMGDAQLKGELELYVTSVTTGEPDELYGKGKLRKGTLSKIIGRSWFSNSIIQWAVDVINRDSMDTVCIIYLDSVADGKLKSSVVKKFVDKKASKLIVFLNVGRATFSDSPLHRDETYISNYRDPITRQTYGAQHYALLSIDFNNHKVFYGDSKGWRTPIVLGSDILNWSQQLYGEEKCMKIVECHDSDFTDEIGHECRYKRCRPNYPFQTCSDVCGPVVVVAAMIAAFSEDMYAELTKETVSHHDISCLQDASLLSNLMRVCIIKWYLEDGINLGDLLPSVSSSVKVYHESRKSPRSPSTSATLTTSSAAPVFPTATATSSTSSGLLSSTLVKIPVYKYHLGYTWKFASSEDLHFVRKYNDERLTTPVKRKQALRTYKCAKENCPAIYKVENTFGPAASKGYQHVEYINKHNCQIHLKVNDFQERHSNLSAPILAEQEVCQQNVNDPAVGVEDMDDKMEEDDSIENNNTQFSPVVEEEKKHPDTTNLNVKTESSPGKIVSLGEADLPLDVSSNTLYHFPKRDAKFKKKYDKIIGWGRASSSNGITKTKCNCGSERFSWLCSKKCRNNETKDDRCCSVNRTMDKMLFVKYIGFHNSSCFADIKIKENHNALEGSLMERAASLFKQTVVEVDEIPDKFVGDEVFVVKCIHDSPGKHLHGILNDGKSYKKSITSNLAISTLFSGPCKPTIYNYNCVGSYFCNNNNCTFYDRFNVVHQIPVREADSKEMKHKCSKCLGDLNFTQCAGRRIVAFQSQPTGTSKNEILVQYKEKHTCSIRSKITEKTKAEIEDYFTQNPSVPPSLAWYNLFVKKINNHAPASEIDQLILAQVRSYVMSNAKANAKKNSQPYDDIYGILENIKRKYIDAEIVNHFSLIMDIVKSSAFCINCKNSVIKMDDESISLVCERCHVTMDDTGSYIFLSSKGCCQTMIDLNYGKSLYGTSCHIDHQPGRTKLFTTYECSIYDPDLQNIVNLFTVHMKRESAAHVATAYAHLNMVLLRDFGESFKPFGFVSDEAGGLRSGTKLMYPDALRASDIFHFKQNCLQLVSKDIGDKNDVLTYLRFTHVLQKASSPTVYDKIIKHFYAWIEMDESRSKKLKSFVEWWDNRRDHWSRAFKPNDIDEHSLAESRNSMIARKTIAKNMSIDQCLIMEIMHLMRHTSRLEELLTGGYTGGRGPNRRILQSKEMDQLDDRISRYPTTAKEVNEMVLEVLKYVGLPFQDIMDCDEDRFLDEDPLKLLTEEFEKKKFVSDIDPMSPHKYQVKKDGSSCSKPGRPKGAPNKKGKVTFADQFDTTIEDDEELTRGIDKMDKDVLESNPKKPRMHGKLRTFPKNWNWMKNKVDDMGTYVVTKLSQFTYTVHDTSIPTYITKTVSFEYGMTSCTCEDLKKKRERIHKGLSSTTYNCKHIVYCMCQIGIESNNVLLRCAHLDPTQINLLKKKGDEWNGPMPKKERKTEKVAVPQFESSEKDLGDDFGKAQREVAKESCMWSAVYYQRKNPLGRGPVCASSINGSHNFKPNELCLRVEYSSFHQRKDKSDKLHHMMTRNERYFCVTDKNCIKNPRASLANRKYSSYKAPTGASIDMSKITIEDQSIIMNLF